MPRMQILTTQEQENFNKPPLFDHMQRKHFFDFPKKLLDIAHSLRNPTNQIGFLLSCGYFRAEKQFFLPQDFHESPWAFMELEDNYSPWDIEKKFVKLIKNHLATAKEDEDVDEDELCEAEDAEETIYDLAYWANRHQFNRRKVNRQLQEYFNKNEVKS